MSFLQVSIVSSIVDGVIADRENSEGVCWWPLRIKGGYYHAGILGLVGDHIIP